MAYSTTNPPALLQDRLMGGGAVWSYISADARAAVVAAGYFSNGRSLGMKLGDVVNCVVDSTGVLTVASVTAVNAGTGAATVTALA
ncbi:MULTISPECIES: hypothetical protein [Raoultella]|jgi:hypothetical protein|uniref:hypothetical protein n=1 Tax=Raoultella TaxID=160674 RepID=UPI0030E40A67